MTLADLGADMIEVETTEDVDPYRNFKDGFHSAHSEGCVRKKSGGRRTAQRGFNSSRKSGPKAQPRIPSPRAIK
nr:CoA transferase [Aminobacter sp. MSH1]